MYKIGDNTRYLAWNVINGLLEILNASLQIKNSAGQIVSEINGDTGAAMFGKGAHKFNPDGSLDLANSNLLYDIVNGLRVVGKIESNSAGKRIIIDPIKRSMQMLDENNKILSEYTFDSENGNSGAKIRMNGTYNGRSTYGLLTNERVQLSADDESMTQIASSGISIAKAGGIARAFITPELVAFGASEIVLENVPRGIQGVSLNRVWVDDDGHLRLRIS